MDLLERASRVGLKPAEFWLLTPAEFVAYCEGQAWRMKQARNLTIMAGWSGEVFARWRGRLPGFQDALRRIFPEPGDGVNRVRAALDSLARRHSNGDT